MNKYNWLTISEEQTKLKFQLAQKLFKRTARIPLASLNYHLGSYKDVIWVTGDGRSGTTWLSDLINWHGQYRVLFEPFHPQLVKDVQQYDFFQYLKIDDLDSPLGFFLNSVFSGKFKHLRSDTSQLQISYKGLLVKDIFSNLMIPWVNHNLPLVKKVMVVRNPFAVALSKQKKKGWTWMTEPKDFLKQKDLYDDHLAPFEDVILASGDDYIEKQILIWAIVHYIPFKCLAKEDIHLLFYEDLFQCPKSLLNQTFCYLYGEEKGETDLANVKLKDKIERPSRTSSKASGSTLMEGRNPLTAWKSELTTEQIDRGIEILQKFNLENIYGVSPLPHKSSLPFEST